MCLHCLKAQTSQNINDKINHTHFFMVTSLVAVANEQHDYCLLVHLLVSQTKCSTQTFVWNSFMYKTYFFIDSPKDCMQMSTNSSTVPVSTGNGSIISLSFFLYLHFLMPFCLSLLFCLSIEIVVWRGTH